MKIQLKSLVLENFRQITGYYGFGPGQNVLSGPNGCGKTTLFDAVKWLHEGKDSTGRADFDIYPIIGGKKASKTDASVTAVYDVNGQERTFGRRFYEKWSKPRGAAEKVKAGNETRFSVDGIDVSKSKYSATLDETFGPNYRLCSDIEHMATMHWKDRRALLMPFAKEVDPAVVIASIDGLADLMGDRDIETAKTAADQRKKKINKEIEELPGKIAELQKIVDGAGGKTPEQAEIEVQAAELAIEEAQGKIDAFGSGDRSEDIEKLRALNQKYMDLIGEFTAACTIAGDAENRRLQDIKNLEHELKNEREDLQDHQEKIEQLRVEWSDIKARTIEDAHPCRHYGESCPYHGQPVPAEALEKAAKDFNINKSKALEENQASGKDTKKEIERIQGIIAGHEKELSELQKIEPDPILKQETTPEIDALKAEIEKLKSVEKSAEVPAELTATLEATKARLKVAQETAAAIKATASSQARIEELTAKKSSYAGELDKIELFLSKYDEYQQAMAAAVEEPVNAMFETVSFRMFETLENGNISQCCKVMDKQGRSYDGALSNGEKIQAGLDMVRTMQKKLDVLAPVFIDNSESVTGPIELNCQFVELRAMKLYENIKTGDIISEPEYNLLSEDGKALYSLVETFMKVV